MNNSLSFIIVKHINLSKSNLQKVGHEVRYNMSDNVPEEAILQAHQYYMDARNEARTNTWFKGEGDSQHGLFNDMLEGIRDIDIQAKPKSNRNG